MVLDLLVSSVCFLLKVSQYFYFIRWLFKTRDSRGYSFVFSNLITLRFTACLHLKNKNQNSNEFWLKEPKSIWFDFSHVIVSFCSSSWCLKRKTFSVSSFSCFIKIFEIISRLSCVKCKMIWGWISVYLSHCCDLYEDVRRRKVEGRKWNSSATRLTFFPFSWWYLYKLIRSCVCYK